MLHEVISWNVSSTLQEINVPESQDITLHVDEIVIEASDHGRHDVDLTYSSQKIPVWSAYNSLLEIKNMSKQQDKVFPLPIIDAPAHNWSTLVTSLHQLYSLNSLVFGHNIIPVCVVGHGLDCGL